MLYAELTMLSETDVQLSLSREFVNDSSTVRRLGPDVRAHIDGDTARRCAFNEEERMADMAVANDAGSFDCFFRSPVSNKPPSNGEHFST